MQPRTVASQKIIRQASNLAPSPAYSLETAYTLDSGRPLLAEYWAIANRRRSAVLATLLTVVVLTSLVTFRMTPVYEASGRIAINHQTSSGLGLREAETNEGLEDWDYNVTMETQARILQSDALAAQLIEKLRLDRRPEFNGRPAAAQSEPGIPSQTADPDPAQEGWLLDKFRSGLRVRVTPGTRIIEIRYSHKDPQLAAAIVNGLENAYIEQNFKTRFDSTAQTSQWLAQQLTDLRLKVETSEEKLVQYQKEQGILGIDEKQNIITAKLDELNKQLTAAEGERIHKQSIHELALRGIPELYSQQQPSSVMEKLRTQEGDLKMQYAQASTQFGAAYPKVAELGNQLKQVQDSIRMESQRTAELLKNDYLAAAQRERMLRAALEAQKQLANRLNESAIEYNTLKRDADSNRQLYEGLSARLKEAGISAGLRSNNIRIVDTARVPRYPVSPNIPKNIFLAVLVGLAGGMGLAFFQEKLDNTVKTAEQAQTVSSLPSLGVIPLNPPLGGKRRLASAGRLRLLTRANPMPPSPTELICFSRPKSEVAESFRALRTSLLLASLGSPPKVILVTSALPQEGKTTTSVNCALVLAQQGGRVLLIDADLRRPNVHNVLRLENESGLARLLVGGARIEEAILPSPQLSNLFVLPAGPTPPCPAELLGSAAMVHLLKQWRHQFDHIVIDTPPVLTVTDAVLLSTEADAVVMVIRAGQTQKAALRRARDLLVQVNAKVSGVVLNACDVNSLHYDGYYYGAKYSAAYYDLEGNGSKNVMERQASSRS